MVNTEKHAFSVKWVIFREVTISNVTSRVFNFMSPYSHSFCFWWSPCVWEVFCCKKSSFARRSPLTITMKKCFSPFACYLTDDLREWTLNYYRALPKKVQSELGHNFFNTYSFLICFGGIREIVYPNSWRVVCTDRVPRPFLTNSCSEKSIMKKCPKLHEHRYTKHLFLVRLYILSQGHRNAIVIIMVYETSLQLTVARLWFGNLDYELILLPASS